MAELFELPELVSYMQVPELDAATAALARELVTTEIRLYVGATAYDALGPADLAAFKGIALEAAKRYVQNPGGLRVRSYSIDDYQESQTLASETLGGVELTEAERDRIDRILGRSSGAFTIRPAGQPDCPRTALQRYHTYSG